MRAGPWQVRFIAGGPELPPPIILGEPASWTDFSSDAERFAGTACYSTEFDAPQAEADELWIDLGTVCDSARIRLNGAEIAALICEPFQARSGTLRPTGNILEIEITNLAANRIRHMDRSGEVWKIFKDINIVDRHYRPFDASAWPVRPAGLLGPVRLLPMGVSPGQTG